MVGRGGEDAVVGLHEVYLGAPLAADLVRIAIVRAAFAEVRCALAREAGRPVDVPGRLLDEVKSEVASAAYGVQVHRETQRPAQELEQGKSSRLPLLPAIRCEAEAGVMFQRQGRATHIAPGALHERIADEAAGPCLVGHEEPTTADGLLRVRGVGRLSQQREERQRP
jgi:hypothetical protein